MQYQLQEAEVPKIAGCLFGLSAYEEVKGWIAERGNSPKDNHLTLEAKTVIVPRPKGRPIRSRILIPDGAVFNGPGVAVEVGDVDVLLMSRN